MMYSFYRKKRDLNIDDKICYASFSWRIAASVIDTVFSLIFLVPIFSIIRKSADITTLKELSDLGSQERLDALMKVLAFSLLELFVMSVVIIIFWMYRAGTIGKIILSMEIVHAKTLEKPSKIQLIGRFFGYILSVLPLGIGFIWIYYDKKQQGFHDKVSSTVVIRHKDNLTRFKNMFDRVKAKFKKK